MALYEHVFLARQDVSAQQVNSLVERFKGILVENGGSVGRIENWGLRTIAYRIKKNRKAHYVMMSIDAPHAAVLEMERQMHINDDVLRHMTVRVGKHSDDPSPIMKKHGVDERSGKSATERIGHTGHPYRDSSRKKPEEHATGE